MALGIRYRKIIGEAVRYHRKAARLTQEKLAEKADLHPVYVGEIERGEETPSIDVLIRIAKAVGIRLRDLVADV